ncbi:MAG: hypothetical protein HKN27_01470, partial [Silicimonas sp.]|nr:hypothetical protein [Silicimonas sp.]
MTPIWRGITAAALAGLLFAVYWLFGPPSARPGEDIASGPEVPAAAVPAAPAETENTAQTEAPEAETVQAEERVAALPLAEAEPAESAEEPDTTAPATTAEPAPDAPAASDPQPIERKSSAEFDIVRVEPGGATLIAGRSVPGAGIKLTVDGKTAGEATADTSGNFVMFLNLGASDTPRVLALTETWLDGTELDAEASVILGPIAPAEVVVAAPTPSRETQETQDVAATEPEAEAEESAEVSAAVQPEAETEEPAIAFVPDPVAPITGDAPATEPTPEIATPAAPTVFIADETGVRVLQSAGDVPDALTNVSIDSISYDAAGEVALSGRATGSSLVRVYLNNSLLIEADIGPGGQWRTDLPDVDTGTYTLRVDEVNASGDVISRAETPFRREAIAAIRSIEQETEMSLAPVSLITVQPGNTLWGIA